MASQRFWILHHQKSYRALRFLMFYKHCKNNKYRQNTNLRVRELFYTFTFVSNILMQKPLIQAAQCHH